MKLKIYRHSNQNTLCTICSLLESKLVIYGVDRARHYGGNLGGTSIVELFQNPKKTFVRFAK